MLTMVKIVPMYQFHFEKSLKNNDDIQCIAAPNIAPNNAEQEIIVACNFLNGILLFKLWVISGR